MADALGETLALALTLAGAALTIGEAIVPGAHLIVLGVALLVAGLVGLLVPSLATPFVLAAMVLGVGAVSLYVYRELDFYGGKGSGRTKDSGSLAGKQGRVVERVTQSSGRVRLYDGGFDPTYTARSLESEIPEGAEIIVVDPGGGSVITVEPLSGADDIDRELARERASSRSDERADERPGETAERESDAE